MKTEPPFPPSHRDHNTSALIRSLIVAIIMLVIIFAATSCTVTTAPDGTRTESPDYNAWLEITRLILADETPSK